MHLQIKDIYLLSGYAAFDQRLHEKSFFQRTSQAISGALEASAVSLGNATFPIDLLCFSIPWPRRYFSFIFSSPKSFIKNKNSFLSLSLQVYHSDDFPTFHLGCEIMNSHYTYSWLFSIIQVEQRQTLRAESILILSSVICLLHLGKLVQKKNSKQVLLFNPFWHTKFIDVGSTIVFCDQYSSFQNLYHFPFAIHLLNYLPIPFDYQLYT